MQGLSTQGKLLPGQGEPLGTLEYNLRVKCIGQKTLEDNEKSATYAHCKVEVESLFGYIKGSHSFRRFSLRGLEKVHTEFGIVAMANNLLKVAGTRLATFLHKQMHKKLDGKRYASPPNF